MYIPWIRYGRPCTNSKKIITDNKVRSPKQRVVERILFMLKIFFCASRETGPARSRWILQWLWTAAGITFKRWQVCFNDKWSGQRKKLIKRNAFCQHDSLLGEVTGLLLGQWQEEPNRYISYLPISLKAGIPMHAHSLRHMHKHRAKTGHVEPVG